MTSAYISRDLRQAIAELSSYRCGYCLTPEALIGINLEIDHLIPRARGGRTEQDNLWLACSSCNDAKHDRMVAIDPQSQIHVPIFNPRHEIWREHFAWSNDGRLIVGLSAVGRATVLALGPNAAIKVRARVFWIAAGVHPPSD